jgi:hypothetical protein
VRRGPDVLLYIALSQSSDERPLIHQIGERHGGLSEPRYLRLGKVREADRYEGRSSILSANLLPRNGGRRKICPVMLTTTVCHFMPSASRWLNHNIAVGRGRVACCLYAQAPRFQSQTRKLATRLCHTPLHPSGPSQVRPLPGRAGCHWSCLGRV